MSLLTKQVHGSRWSHVFSFSIQTESYFEEGFQFHNQIRADFDVKPNPGIQANSEQALLVTR